MNIEEFKNIFEDCKIEGNKIIITSNIRDALIFVSQNYGFKMLNEIIGVDKGDGWVELIYHLYSVVDEENLFVSINVKEEIESVSDLFKSAIADEKEIYDLFGIRFLGHADLKRLYMPENWDGNPLRKDYVQKDERLAWNDEA